MSELNNENVIETRATGTVRGTWRIATGQEINYTYEPINGAFWTRDHIKVSLNS